MNYKYSKYNYFHEYCEDVVCINLLKKEVIILSQENYSIIEKATKSASELEISNPHLFSLLYKLGFIIKSSTDEMSVINTMYNSSIFRSSNYQMTILPTMDCNFKCWYCYEEKKKSSISNDVINSIYKHFENKIKYDKISGINLDWFGGEPLMNFDDVMYPISIKIKKIAKDNQIPYRSQITTNGYLINDEMIKKFKEIELKQFQITIDGYEEYHNNVKKGKDSYSRTIENINRLCEEIDDVNMLLRINFTDENIEKSVDIIKDIRKENIKKLKVSFQRVWQVKNNNGKYSNLEEVKSKFKEAGFVIDSYRIENVQGCYADRLEQIVISYDGLVYKCTARDFVEKNSDGKLNLEGFIEWNTEKHSKRFGRRRYDYKQCQECLVLPACFGPCSQKVLETPIEQFESICNVEGFKSSINAELERVYHSILD